MSERRPTFSVANKADGGAPGGVLTKNGFDCGSPPRVMKQAILTFSPDSNVGRNAVSTESAITTKTGNLGRLEKIRRRLKFSVIGSVDGSTASTRCTSTTRAETSESWAVAYPTAVASAGPCKNLRRWSALWTGIAGHAASARSASHMALRGRLTLRTRQPTLDCKRSRKTALARPCSCRRTRQITRFTCACRAWAGDQPDLFVSSPVTIALTASKAGRRSNLITTAAAPCVACNDWPA
jgi:hypothetical protein